jgi:RND family efflux transporter MFP subunit
VPNGVKIVKRPKNDKLYMIKVFLIYVMAVFPTGCENEKYIPEIQRRPLSVETIVVYETDYQIRIPAWGQVEPIERIDIRPEIPGKVTEVSSGIFTGASVEQGAFLFSLDERDYRNKLAEAIAEEEQARQALEIEKGRQTIAQIEWEMLENSKWHVHKNKALALREPQLKELQASLKIANARRARVELEIGRTKITAPCKGDILMERLAMGQVLEAGYIVMQIVCTDCYHIPASFSPEYSPDPGERPVVIKIGSKRYEGKVKSILPDIDSKTRQKRALVEFRGADVFLGDYASLILPGRSFQDVVVLPREALRSESTVWILNENGTLEIRSVNIIARDKMNIVIEDDLSEGEQVIISHIASPLQGMDLKKMNLIKKESQDDDSSEERIE